MQTESNECLQVGLEVYYISYGKHLYNAKVKKVHEHDRCDLLVYGSVDGKVPLGTATLYLASYDSEGEQPHSWHKKSDVTAIGQRLSLVAVQS